MREIKFRGKRKDKNEWEYGFLLEDSELIDDKNWEKEEAWKRTYYILVDKDEWHEIIPETIGQFTGLYDKNGKEIYEGDILKTWYGTGVVKFFNGCFYVDGAQKWLTDEEWTDLLCSFGSEELEVIGNIYDNPELLKEE